MSIVSWNIRGLTARPKRVSLRKLITSHNPIFVFIQETKMSQINEKTIRTCWKSNEAEWIFSPSIGNSGGLLSLWKKSNFVIKSSNINQHWIAISGQFQDTKFEGTLINIYNPCDIALRANVWREIKNFQQTNPLPCLIIGDFNEVLNSNERGSHVFSQGGSNDFKSFMQDLHLLEIPSSSKDGNG